MHRARVHAEREEQKPAARCVCGGGQQTLKGGGEGLWASGACVRGRCAAVGGRPRHAGCRGPGAHSNEREGAIRSDCDASGVVELCAGADVVVVDASDAAAGEGGGRSGADVDTADAVVGSVTVLRCIGHKHTLSEEQSRRQGAWRRAPPEGRQSGPVGRVCETGAPLRVKATTRGVQGGRHAQQRALRCRSGRLRRYGGGRIVRWCRRRRP